MKTFTFICGCGHTGTSLLANMFAAHPDVYVPLRETESFLVDREARSRWNRLLREAEGSGKAHLLEKTPRHIHKLDLIERLVPDARFVLTVRDGRDVAASFVKRYGSAKPGIERWIHENALVSMAVDRPNTILVRYEDLIRDPAGKLQDVCTFLGIPFAAEMLEYHKEKRLWFGVPEMRKGTGEAGEEHRLLRNWQINQPIFDGRGGWKDILQESEVQSFAQGVGLTLMQRFGYATEGEAALTVSRPNVEAFAAFLSDIAPFFAGEPVTYVDAGPGQHLSVERLLNSGVDLKDTHILHTDTSSLDASLARLTEAKSASKISIHEFGAKGSASGRTRGKNRKGSAASADRLLTLDGIAGKFARGGISILRLGQAAEGLELLAGARKLLQTSSIEAVFVEVGDLSPVHLQKKLRRLEQSFAAHGLSLFGTYESQEKSIAASAQYARAGIAFVSSRFRRRNQYPLAQELLSSRRAVRDLTLRLDSVSRSSEAQESVSLDMERANETLTTKSKSAERQLEKKNALLDEERALRQATENAVRDAEQRLVALNQLNEQTNTELASLKSRLRFAEGKEEAAGQAMEALNNQAALMSKQLDFLKAELESRSSQSTEFGTQVASLRASLDKTEASRSFLAEKLKATEDHVASLQTRRLELEGTLKETEASRSTLIEKLRINEDHTTSLQTRFAQLENALRAAGESRSALAEKLADVEERATLLQARCVELEGALAESIDTADRISTERKAASDSVERLMTENRDALDRITITDAALAEANAERMRMDEDRQRLRGEILELRRALEGASTATNRMTAEAQQTSLALQAALDAVAQTHRRELGARRDARKLRDDLQGLESGMEFLLGRHLVERLAAHVGWISALRSLRKEYLRLATAPRHEGGTATTETDLPAATLLASKDAVMVPLTLKPIRVELPETQGTRELWVTYFSARRAARATVELSLPRSLAARIEGIPAPPASGPEQRAEPTHRRTEVVSGTPMLALVLEPLASGSSMTVLRVRGEFGVLKLELRLVREKIAAPPKPDPEMADASATILAGATTGNTINKKGQPAADAQSDKPSLLPAPETAASGFESGLPLKFGARELEQKLWGGYARYAIPALEELRDDTSAPASERESAAWSLLRWHYVEEEFQKALDNIEIAKSFTRKPRPRIALTEALCLNQLQRYGEALEKTSQHPAPSIATDMALLRSTILRNARLAETGALEDAESAQLDAINAVLSQHGLSALRKRDVALPLTLSNVVSDAVPDTDSQDLKVSIVMPAFNAADTISWAIDSILRQTWSNLELIVVDDLSTDETCNIVENIALTDSRVRLIRKAVNEGAYPARNAGLKEAGGDLIMVHDSDDWSHPRRLEMQINHLLSQPDAMAVKSYWIRVGPQLEMMGPWVPKGTLFDLNFSSLLFRRSLLSTIGYWDNVSVGGDAEFYSRIQALYGKDSVLKIGKDIPLALALTRETSLTRSKATHLKTFYFGLRWNYLDSYLFWHSRLPNNDLPRTEFQHGTRRTFPVPLGNKPANCRRANYDLAIVSDFANDGEILEWLLKHSAIIRKYNVRIAAFHWRPYWLNSRTPLLPSFYEACLALDMEILSPGDRIAAGHVLVARSEIAAYPIDPSPQIDTTSLLVLAEEEKASTSQRSPAQQYEVSRTLSIIFKCAPTSAPIEAIEELMFRDIAQYAERSMSSGYKEKDTQGNSWPGATH